MKRFIITKHTLAKKYRTIIFAFLFLTSNSLTSCKKFLEIPLPQNKLVSGSVFSDDQSATSAIVGIYSDMMQTFKFISFNATLFPALSADEYNYPSKSTATWVQFQNNSVTIDNADVNTCWSQGYLYIYDANAAIEGLQASTGVTPATRDQLLGEAKFIRAFNYFYLVNLFGDIPLILTTDYQTNSLISRSATSSIYNQIIQDLKDAQQLLPKDYATTDRVRPNYWTATALLARTYLYTKDWQNAQVQASAIINSGTYSLSALSSVFIKSSNETIWQLMPVNASYNTLIGARIVPRTTTQIPLITLTSDLINNFEPTDQRLSSWVGKNIVGGTSYYYFYKYKITSSTPVNEYFVVFRLAEQYLIRAEANLNLNNSNDAISDINIIRSRAGLPLLSGNYSVDQLTTSIEKERRIELYGEWGHRWFDLKRNNRLDAVIGAYKPSTWKSTSSLWPIPLTQRNANPNLTQNPGY